MHALVTGGSGFIGSTLVDHLLAGGHQVTVVDNFSRGVTSNLPEDNHQLSVVPIDIRDRSLRSVFAGAAPEVVFHLAGHIDQQSSIEDPHADAEINVLGTLNVAQATRRCGARKLVFASSGGSIYGEVTRLPTDETAATDPISPYAVSKLAGEMYLNSMSRLHGVQCTHLALANVYGPRQHPHGESGVIAVFTEALLNGAPTKLFGDGGNTRDYVFVADVARAFIAAAGEAGNRRRYNIGTGVQTTDRQVHRLVAEAIGVPDEPEIVAGRPGDLRASALDSGAARRDLGWEPRVDVASGIAATVAAARQLARS